MPYTPPAAGVYVQDPSGDWTPWDGGISGLEVLNEIAQNTDRIPLLGQATNAQSMPVVLTAAQLAALAPSAQITGFALEGGKLTLIEAKTPALGQALAAESVPVVLTALQLAALVPYAPITGFALENGKLSLIEGKIPALGQAVAASSMPVVLTALQLAALTPPAAITGFALENGHLAAIDLATDGIEAALGLQAKLTDTQPVIDASNVALVASTGVAGLNPAAYGTELWWLQQLNNKLQTLAKDSTLQKLVPVSKSTVVRTTLLHRT